MAFYFLLYIKMNTKQIKDLHVTAKVIKFSEIMIRILYNLGYGNGVSDISPKAEAQKIKTKLKVIVCIPNSQSIPPIPCGNHKSDTEKRLVAVLDLQCYHCSLKAERCAERDKEHTLVVATLPSSGHDMNSLHNSLQSSQGHSQTWSPPSKYPATTVLSTGT